MERDTSSFPDVEGQATTACEVPFRESLTAPERTLSNVIVLPSFITEDEDWLYSEEAQQRLLEAEADVAAGQFITFEDVEELILELKS